MYEHDSAGIPNRKEVKRMRGFKPPRAFVYRPLRSQPPLSPRPRCLVCGATARALPSGRVSATCSRPSCHDELVARVVAGLTRAANQGLIDRHILELTRDRAIARLRQPSLLWPPQPPLVA